jgi:hypothetical protein
MELGGCGVLLREERAGEQSGFVTVHPGLAVQ